MRARLSLVLLLLISTATTIIGHPVNLKGDEPAGQEATPLTPEEEREARALALQFIKEFGKTLDMSPLISGGLFVSDLPERMRQHKPNESFSILAEPSVIEQASDEDLRRYFAAVTNASFMWWALVATDEFRKRHGARREECGERTSLEKLVPLEAIAVLKTDPTFGPSIAKWMGEEEEETAEAGDDSDNGEGDEKFTSPERLKIFVALFEEAMVLARRHLNGLPAWQQARSHLAYFNPALAADARETINLEVTKLTEDFLGQREGERLICARVLMFHLDLIRVGGKLKILSVSQNDHTIRTKEERRQAAQLEKLFAAIEVDDEEAFDALVRAGVDINARDDDCTTPLVYAALSRRSKMVKALISMGAEVNVGNSHGNTALMYAAGGGDEEMTEALLDAGADLNAKNESGATALDLAMSYTLSENHRKVIQLLRSRGADSMKPADANKKDGP